MVAKNYLSQPEISELNRIVTMFLDYAEDQAKRNRDLADSIANPYASGCRGLHSLWPRLVPSRERAHLDGTTNARANAR